MEIINCTINQGSSVLAVLKMIDQLPSLQTVFVFDAEKKIIGTITDGDIRRGFINGLSLEGLVQDFMNKDFSFLLDGDDNFNKLNDYRARKLKAVPLISDKGNLIKVYDFNHDGLEDLYICFSPGYCNVYWNEGKYGSENYR